MGGEKEQIILDLIIILKEEMLGGHNGLITGTFFLLRTQPKTQDFNCANLMKTYIKMI